MPEVDQDIKSRLEVPSPAGITSSSSSLEVCKMFSHENIFSPKVENRGFLLSEGEQGSHQ